jgi:hypothetical protein
MQRNPTLLALPPELCHKIFILVVAFTPAATIVDARTLLSCTFHGIRRSDLSILLTSRHFNAETRLLPFQCNDFALPLWFGSLVFAAIRFLKALRPFQVDALRRVEMKFTRADLGVLGRVEILLDDEGRVCEEYAAGRGTCSMLRGGGLNVGWRD